MKITLIIPLLILAGCASPKISLQEQPPVDTQIISHARNGASSVEVMLETLKKSDFEYLAKEKLSVSTNYYKSSGKVVPFAEIKW